MNYRSIRNNTVYNLKNCDEEPIHIPGSIQPTGFLIAVDRASGHIKFCSENIEAFIGLRVAQVLDKEPLLVFGNAFADAVNAGSDSDFSWEINGGVFSGQVHTRGSYTVVECEPSGSDTRDDDIYTSSRQLLQYVEGNQTLVQLCQTVATEIKSVTGYDRVMIYRFDAEYNGEVIAEAKEAHLEGFLGLHYPHTDIPVQARQLYMINQLRLISDVNYEPVPIYTSSGDRGSTLDMSLCTLRSVSPIHLEYLRNMGVYGTLTISLLHRGRLWGLIACHHYSPRYITLGMRLTAKLLGHFIVSQIDVRILNEEFEKKRAADEAYDRLTAARLSLGNESLEQLIQSSDFLRMCNATGVVIMLDGQISKKGSTPNNEHIRSLSATLTDATNCKSFHTAAIAEWDQRYADLSSTVPGLNYYCLGSEGDCVMWFRAETVKEVTWAGDPNKAIEKNAAGLSPRKSFLGWKQVVKGKTGHGKRMNLRHVPNL